MDKAISVGLDWVTGEDLYRRTMENSGIAVFLFDREGNRVFANDEGVALVGKPREELLQGRFGDCLVEEDRERAIVCSSVGTYRRWSRLWCRRCEQVAVRGFFVVTSL